VSKLGNTEAEYSRKNSSLSHDLFSIALVVSFSVAVIRVIRAELVQQVGQCYGSGKRCPEALFMSTPGQLAV